MKKKITLVVALASLLASCGGNSTDGTENDNKIDSIKQEDNTSEMNGGDEAYDAELAVSINGFTEFPAEIDGCSCYFAATQEKFKTGEYIYVDDFGNENGFMMLDGEMRNFKKVSSVMDDRAITTTTIMESGDLQVILIYDQTNQEGETFEQKGILTINGADGSKKSVDIVGECGC